MQFIYRNNYFHFIKFQQNKGYLKKNLINHFYRNDKHIKEYNNKFHLLKAII